MFDCSLYSADGIREAADVRHEIIEYQIEQLSLLGYKRDIQIHLSRWLQHARF